MHSTIRIMINNSISYCSRSTYSAIAVTIGGVSNVNYYLLEVSYEVLELQPKNKVIFHNLSKMTNCDKFYNRLYTGRINIDNTTNHIF